jgi:hypothetical protein
MKQGDKGEKDAIQMTNLYSIQNSITINKYQTKYLSSNSPSIFLEGVDHGFVLKVDFPVMCPSR